MYEYNTLEGKICRVEELRKLRSKIACVPGTYISYSESHAISHYLGDIISDLERQIKKEQKERQEIIRSKAEAVNKALFDCWGTKMADQLWEELGKCTTPEEIAQLYDLIFKPTRG